MKKCFDQLLGAHSTQKLVKIHNKQAFISYGLMPQGSKIFICLYEQMPQAWVWAHHISTLVRLLPDHRVL